jgi:hypothetical protein
MKGSRVNHIGHAQLFDPAQALKPRMFDQVEKERIGYSYESVNRVVEDFSAVKGGMPHLCSIFV